MSGNFLEDAQEIKRRLTGRGQNVDETVICELLESCDPDYVTDRLEHVISMITGEKNNNFQDSSDNQGPSIIEISTELHDDTDKVSNPETQSSSTESTGGEIIDIPSDSDDDRDYYYCDTSNSNDISVIDIVKTDTVSSGLLTQLNDNRTSPNQVVTSNDSRAIKKQIQGKILDLESKIKILEENNNILCRMENVSFKRNILSNSSKPGCSKDSDDASCVGKVPLSEGFYTTFYMVELRKNANMIHSLLPKIDYNLIYKTLCNNRYARNYVELTLWDLLPQNRPIAQYLCKRRSTDDVCPIERKKNITPQQDKMDTKAALEKEEQARVESEVDVNVKSENKGSTLLRDMIDGMIKDISGETTALNNLNNDTNQQSIGSKFVVGKAKLNRTQNVSVKYTNYRDVNTHTMQDSKKSIPLEVDSKIKELQSTKNSEVSLKGKLISPSSTSSVTSRSILQPAKLTFCSDTSLQKDQVDTKTTLEKKKQACAGNNVKVAENNLRSRKSTSLMDKTEMEGENILEEAAGPSNANNNINQQNVAPLKVNLQHVPMRVVQELLVNQLTYPHTYPNWESPKKSVSSEVDSNTKLQLNSEMSHKKDYGLFSDNTPSLEELQMTFLNLMDSTNNITLTIEKLMQKLQNSKPAASILTPPKLQLVTATSGIPVNAAIAKREGPSVVNLGAHDSSAIKLPNTSPDNKKASNIGCSSQPPNLLLNPGADATISQNKILSEKAKVEVDRFIKFILCYKTTKLRLYPRQWISLEVIQAARKHYKTRNKTLSDNEKAELDRFLNFLHRYRDSELPYTGQLTSPAKIAQNTSDQKASSSKANLQVGNMNAPQVCDRGDEKQRYSMLADAEANTSKEKPKDTVNDANRKEIVLNTKASKIYAKLIPMFPCIQTQFIKQVCHKYVKNDEQSQDEAALLEYLVEILLNCDQKHPSIKKVEPITTAENSTVYDLNEQYADLLMIFPEADPVYLREVAEKMHNNREQIKEFVQSKLENPDYPTRAQYLAKKKITEQQKQYTTDFQVLQFLEIFADPFAYFEDEKRKCHFNPHAVDFLKYYFSKLRVNTLVNAYDQYRNNLSLTAKALEVLNPDMKTKRYCNKTALTEDIPFLQECAFIQHKAELRKYLDEMRAKEEEEFNELKARNELLECQCCYDNECMPSKCSTCEDGHIFCNLCIVRSTDVVLADGNTHVECLLSCGCEFSMSVLQRVLPPTKFSILLCKRQEAEIMAAEVEGLVSCPFCHFASIPPPEDKIFKCLNPECMKESCRLCKELNHIPLKCNENKSESARLYLEERMTQALVRKCYRCSRMFFKEEGCNKMTCPCGAQMCYICDKPVTDYRHFQGQGAERSNLCPLWSDDRRLNAESVITVCQETMKQIKEKDPKVDINVDALLPKLPPKRKGPHESIANLNPMLARAQRIAKETP